MLVVDDVSGLPTENFRLEDFVFIVNRARTWTVSTVKSVRRSITENGEKRHLQSYKNGPVDIPKVSHIIKTTKKI